MSINFPNRKSSTGRMIDDFLKNKINLPKEVIHLLFSANRWEVNQEIKNCLSAGRDVICDRYWYSGVAYSYAQGLDL